MDTRRETRAGAVRRRCSAGRCTTEYLGIGYSVLHRLAWPRERQVLAPLISYSILFYPGSKHST